MISNIVIGKMGIGREHLLYESGYAMPFAGNITGKKVTEFV
jgi:hypothetical protein